MTRKQYLLEDSVGYLIFTINHRMYSYFREKLDQEGVNVVEAWILLQILNGVETVSKLKNILKVDMALIHRSCGKLIEKKWVTRVVDKHDRRVKNLALTRQGKNLIHRIIKYSKKTNEEALSVLTEEKRNELRKLLMEVLAGPFCQEFIVNQP